jgi:hypothetical protein
MTDYIVCQKKRNAPRMNVRVCEKRCPFKHECEAFLACNRAPADERRIPISSDNPSPVIAAT